jgi:SAM-dependent methyltransferase
MPSERLESWHSADYAAQWAGDDVLADLLELPRQISVALVQDSRIRVHHVVDLGAGPGPYLERFLRAFPDARGTWVDSSDAMREIARERLEPFGDRVEFVLADLEQLDGADLEPADVAVTSRVLHHFSPESLHRFYRAAHELVAPGGFFFNLDHVGAPGDWEQVYRRVRKLFTPSRKKTLKPHRHDYPLSRADEHVAWAAAAGFETPDVPWRTFYTALVAARRAGTASAR